MDEHTDWFTNEDVGHLITVRRGWFNTHNTLAMGLLSFFSMGALFLTLYFVTSQTAEMSARICLPPFFLVLWALSTWGAIIHLKGCWGQTIKLNKGYVRHYHDDSLTTEILFDSSVRADVRLDSTNSCAYIEGIRFTKGDDEIELISWKGWGEDNMQNFWKPFIVVVRRHEMRMGDALEKFLRVNRVPEEHAARDLMVRRPFVDQEKAVDDWITRASKGTHETRRAQELIGKSIGSNDMRGHYIWHTLERSHPTLTTLKLFMLITLVGGPFIGVAWERYKSMGLVIGLSIIAVALIPWFWFAVGSTRFATVYHQGEPKLHPGASFRTLAGVLKAHGIEYRVNRDTTTMASRAWGQFDRLLSLEFSYQGFAYSIDVSGNAQAVLWFGPEPEGGDEGYETLLYHTSKALLAEKEWKDSR
ncbi:MAG: hypothetical protein JSW25_06255 [Thermoplasmata archaeon]|nr:MAG: hypothetical protein JSW25_06255 [Thermoplasmata archaeon]